MARLLSLRALAAATAVAAAAGCYTGPVVDFAAPAGQIAPVVGANGDPGASTSGLPCDLATVLANKCTPCHGAVLAGGAPNALLARADLVVPSRTNPTISMAELSIQRMQETAKPMPPNGSITAEEIAVFQAWVSAGMPEGVCDTPIASSSADYNTPTVCTSGTSWTRGDHGSSSMHPGKACAACHSKEREGPRYAFAGTIYPTAHEPDDCNGYSDRDVSVIITGADGTSITLAPNAVGNFATRKTVPLPYTVKLVRGDAVREMLTPQRSGDCNTCHTLSGTEKAPGRIMAP